VADDELIYSARVFRVVRRRYSLADGSGAEKECILHPGAVAIVPLTDDGRVCLIRNHRVTVERTLIEVPAGTLEPGEDPAVCAARELEEETGYTAGKLEKLTSFFMSPGILNERMHVFLATSLRAGPTQLQPGEEIENHLVPWNEALALVERGEIEDGKTVAALLYADRFRRRELPRGVTR
jgi:ADP-ribose pyrophosphatase